MTDELKLCPFCGGDPQLLNGGPGNWYVRCAECKVSTNDVQQDHAIELWNARPRVAQTRGLTDELPPWEDPRVQLVYEMLCDDELNTPPNSEEHWEGWISRNIVRGLAALAPSNPAQRQSLDLVRSALEFYADPFAWKKKHDPEDVLRIPDFYSETSFGDTAMEALAALAPGNGAVKMDREKLAKIFAVIWHGDIGEWEGFLSKADAFLAYPGSLSSTDEASK